MSDVTRILGQIESGDPAAAEQLLPLVYDELHKLAAQRLSREKPGQTYLHLDGGAAAQHWDGRKVGDPRQMRQDRCNCGFSMSSGSPEPGR